MWKYENKQSEIEGGSILTIKEEDRMEIFVVSEGMGLVLSTSVNKADWQRKGNVCGRTIIEAATMKISPGMWHKGSYAGFNTSEAAIDFVDLITTMREVESNPEMRKKLAKMKVCVCTTCSYMNKSRHFGEDHNTCPICGGTSIGRA